KALQEVIQELKVDSFLISNFYNILYFSGIKTLSPDEREAYILVTKNKTYVFTDARYVEKRLMQRIDEIQATFKLIEPGKGLMFHLDEIIKNEKLQHFGFESEDLKFIEYTAFKGLPIFECKSLPRVGLDLRTVKDQQEVQTIKRACDITDQCLEELYK